MIEVLRGLLWSDPEDGLGTRPSRRGCGVGFGPDVTKAFLDKHGLTALVRGHQCPVGGYALEHDGCCMTLHSTTTDDDRLVLLLNGHTTDLNTDGLVLGSHHPHRIWY